MSKSMFVAFPNGGSLPEEITGGEEKHVPAHEPVRVPQAYGEHLIHDGFAYAADAPKKGDGSKKSDPKSGRAGEIAALLEDLRKALAEATDDVDKERLGKEIAVLEDEANGLKV